MPDPITKTQRWLDLISYLVGRRYPVAVGELLERLPVYRQQKYETARDYLERDLRELRGLGIPIVYRNDPEQGYVSELQGYVLDSHDFFLPYLRIVQGVEQPAERRAALKPGTLTLSAEHASDAAEALLRVAALPESPFADAARVAYAKLALDLDASALREAPVHIADAPAPAERRVLLGTLSDALIERRTVDFRYTRPGREPAARSVDPYGLIRHGSSWYLVGHDHERGALRQFRVERIAALEPRPDGKGRNALTAPHFDVPADFRIGAYAHRQAWELGGETETIATVRFPFPWSLWAERNGHGELVAEEAGGASVRRFRLLATEPFLRWLLSAEAELELLGPPELVRELGAMAAAVARLYDGDEIDA